MITLDNNEKLYILDLKGKFNHVDKSNDIIVADAYAIEVDKLTDLTRKAFISQLYTKLLKADIIHPYEDKIDILMKYLARSKDDPFETMRSDMGWLTADQMRKLDVYDCDMSILN